MNINKKKVLFGIKVFVMLAILFIVVRELANILKDFDMNLFNKYSSELSVFKILIIVCLGIISYLPLSFYDFTLKKNAQINLSNKKLYKYSLIASSVASMAGFGGSTAIALKNHFYKDHVKDNKLLIKETSKIVALNFTGFSVTCLFYVLFNLKSVFTTDIKNMATIAIALYTPIVIGTRYLKYLKDKTAFEGNLKDTLRISFISCLEWLTTIVLIYSIFLVLGEKVNFMVFFPIFVSAILVSIVAMAPGGIGAFDATLLYGLGNLGIAHEKILLAILLYRVTYYLIPLAIGIILYISELFEKIDENIKSIVTSTISGVSHLILKFLVFSAGAVLLISATVPTAFDRIKWVNKIYNFRFTPMAGDMIIVIGFLLVAISTVIAYKSRTVYKITIVLVALGAILSLANRFSYEETLYLGAVGIALYFSKHQFYREGFILRWGKVMRDCILLLSFQAFYIYVVHMNLKNKIDKIPFATRQFKPQHAHRILHLSFIGFVTALALLGLLYYINKSRKFPRLTLAETEDKLNNILEKYDGAPLIHYAYLNDKYIYINDKEDILIQYQIFANKVVVLGNPIGDKQNLVKRIEEFYELCDKFGYTPIFCSIDGSMIANLHDTGYQFMKLGEDGGVDVENFSLEGRKMKSVRNALSRVEKQGYTFEIMKPPFDKSFLNELKCVSDEWLDGKDEKGFSVGFFDEIYLSRQPIAVVKNSENELKGFASLMPMYDNDQTLSIDLMRFSKDSCNGVMDYIFVNLFLWSKDHGYKSFNMGLAPLSNVGVSRYSFLSEKIASQIYLHGSSIYSFQGLRSYKEKYCTTWDARYVAFKKKTSLIFTLIQVMLLLKKGVKNKQVYNNDVSELIKKAS